MPTRDSSKPQKENGLARSIKNGSKMSLTELALLEEEKIAFIQRLRNQFGPRLKKYHSVHVQVRDLEGQRIVSFSVNGPDNKGVVVFLIETCLELLAPTSTPASFVS